MSAPRVALDLVAIQSPSYKGRGIARYSADFARAMLAHYPEMVSALVVHPELGPLEGADDLASRATSEPDWDDVSVLHLSSVFEPEVPVSTYWPRQAAAHGVLTAVTLYDLIPDVFPGWYLEDPGLRRRWRCCREVVRAADGVLTLSESAKQDAISLLGVPAKRVAVVGGGVSPMFRRPKSRQAAFNLAKRSVKSLAPGFVLYQGAFDRRKNVDGLLEAYARLPRELVAEHQLVIACAAPPLTRNHYLVMAKELGVEGRVLITGFVPDRVLVSLYQSAALAVYPSLYEGFGLPVLESMACGAPTIASDNSSLREMLPREARFEPSDPEAMAQAMKRALTDGAFRDHLSELAGREPPSWGSVADRAAQAFTDIWQRRGGERPAWRRRPHLALVDPPPELAHALLSVASFDTFSGPGDERSSPPPPGSGDRPELLPLSVLAKLDAWRGGYDAIVAWALPSSGANAEHLLVALSGQRGWAGRTTLIVSPEQARDAASTLPPQSHGVQVLALDSGLDWAQKAQAVARHAGALLAR
jgi:glycosyltransferase involved in cell wall biosynthesis